MSVLWTIGYVGVDMDRWLLDWYGLVWFGVRVAGARRRIRTDVLIDRGADVWYGRGRENKEVRYARCSCT